MQVCQNPSTGSEDNIQKRSYTDAGADSDGICSKINISSPFGWAGVGGGT